MPKLKYTHWAKTYEEAIEFLSTGRVEKISLDHDLGDDGIGTRAKTGYDVACWIEDRAKENKIPRMDMSVHSANPVGADNISRAISKCYEYWDEHGTSPPKTIFKKHD